MDRLVLALLRDAGIECLTAAEAGTLGRPDEAQLLFATERNMASITANRVDFQRLHNAWAAAGREHAGIIIISDQQTPVTSVVSQLRAIQVTHAPAAVRNALLFVRRKLPEEPA